MNERHKAKIPAGWVWAGMRRKGRLGFPIYVFKHEETGLSKGFSGWEVQPPTKERAVEVLTEWLASQPTSVPECDK